MLDILTCVSPPVLHLELHAPNGTAIIKHTFNPGTQTERIDENTQVKVILGNAPDLVTLQVCIDNTSNCPPPPPLLVLYKNLMYIYRRICTAVSWLQ